MDSATILACLSSSNQTDEIVPEVYEWFKRKVEIFTNLTLDTMRDILNTAKVIEMYPNEIIIRQGDHGDCFYVLLNGSASVFINADPNNSIKEEPSETIHSRQDRSARLEKVHQMKLALKKIVNVGDRKIYGEFIRRCVGGECFGELALIQTENIRNATIIVEEKCHLLKISRDIFDKAIRSAAELIYKEKISFVNSHFLFRSRTPKFKHQIAMSLTKSNIYFGQDLTVQGQQSTGLTILTKGEAKIVIDVKKHHKQYKSFVAYADTKDSPLHEVATSARADNIASRRREKIEVAIIGCNDIIGDLEFSFNLPTNLSTVTALEMCEVYLLKNVHLERMTNSSSVDMLQDLAELKLSAYYKRCSNFGDLPLFKLLLSDVEAEMEKFTETISKQNQKISLLPIFKTGPLIDFYGPGSVFFRNKLKRKLTQIKHKPVKQEIIKLNETIRETVSSEEAEKSTLPILSELQVGHKKSIFSARDNKKDTFNDWETSSQHLNDLENRMHRLISTIEGCKRSATELSINSAILRLPRFKHDELPKECQFISKYKRTSNENAEDFEKKITERKDEDEEIGKKVVTEAFVRQYTELEYSRLKEEMKEKEKRLSRFRLKYSI